MSAMDDVLKMLDPGEMPEVVVFGEWAAVAEPGGDDGPPVPPDMRGVPILWDMAVRDGWFEGWSFKGGYGGVDCYAVTIYTDRSIIVVGCYDGSSWLHKIPRHPVAHWPEAIGGG